MSEIINGHRPHPFITGGLISYLPMVYLFAKHPELLISVLLQGYLGAMIFFAIKRNFMVTICWAGSFLVKYKFIK